MGCVLIHWGARDLPIDERLHGYPHCFFGLGDRADGGVGDYRVRYVGRRGTYLVQREHFYLCKRKADQPAATVFKRQATEAARCLDEIPRDVLSQIQIPSRNRQALSNEKDMHWIWGLFDLPWQQPPDSPRHASRTIWGFVDGEDRRIPELVACFPHDHDAIRRHYEEHGDDGGKLPFLSKWAQKLPNRYVSHIPDVFTFSAWMVNLLLDLRQGEAAIVPTRLAVEEPAACLFRDEGAVYRVRFNGEAGTLNASLIGEVHLRATPASADVLRGPGFASPGREKWTRNDNIDGSGGAVSGGEQNGDYPEMAGKSPARCRDNHAKGDP